ncbi:hypothetical protein P7C73_g4147, partial [Tremellales sp. Uapishka_1]
MSFLGLQTASNLSFYAIPAAWVTAIAPHLYAIAVYTTEQAPGTPEFNYVHPSENVSKIKDAKLSPAAQGRFLRAESAQNNGFINIPFFAAAVLAGNFARLPASTLNTCAGAYLVSRVVYNLLYITTTDNNIAKARTLTYFAGIGACFTLLIQAGNKFANGYISL